MNLVFIDPKCPRPYDSEVLETRGLGGTEATVVRIAHALAQRHTVHVLQHNRGEERSESSTLHFAPMAKRTELVSKADHIVFVQKAQDLPDVARATRARLWLWLHNFLKDEVPLYWQDHLRFRLGIVCVSRTHATHTTRYMRRHPVNMASLGWARRGGVAFHYNPLAPGLRNDTAVQRNPQKLVFFSSPHKGIAQVLAQFDLVYRANPQMRLFVADPGYFRTADLRGLDHPGVVRLGTLPQSRVLQHVQEALCVFYPQSLRPETFGLVYSEANAVGTPVLAHDFGAAREVLSPTNPPIDINVPGQVQAQLRTWTEGGAPRLQADGRFLITNVVRGWERFFEAPDAFMRQQERDCL